MNIDYPYRFDGRGRTAEADDNDHIRDPSSRCCSPRRASASTGPDVRLRPAAAVFAPNSEELAAATQFLVQGSLQQWLGDLIEVNDVAVVNDDATLLVTVRYTVRRTMEEQTARFTRPGVV